MTLVGLVRLLFLPILLTVAAEEAASAGGSAVSGEGPRGDQDDFGGASSAVELGVGTMSTPTEDMLRFFSQKFVGTWEVDQPKGANAKGYETFPPGSFIKFSNDNGGRSPGARFTLADSMPLKQNGPVVGLSPYTPWDRQQRRFILGGKEDEEEPGSPYSGSNPNTGPVAHMWKGSVGKWEVKFKFEKDGSVTINQGGPSGTGGILARLTKLDVE
eukprot:CAMPEP_0170245434 /NCGR_PEP_ID=MMETSP0116_2-20130129/22503_1 /TAXON_ID=400756 /ORGANISM="Durinskia baltica, Strain CSIRO CS-38" /LENGTH=214 /DNA_ID=CAMNT_0010496309 /DNA_START=96 /DNA_END=740 /DNA_ORIENTATION=-